MRALRPAVTALLLCLVANPGASEPLISKTYSYFTIGGRTGAELEQQLHSLGPMMSDTGTRHAGATRIKLGGTVSYESTDGRCRVIDAKVSLETHLTLPRWKDRKRASREMAIIWEVLSADIKRHEERHAEIARQYARELERSLEGLRPERSCETMQARVDATSRKIIERHSAEQERFDRAEAASYERRMTRMLGFALEKERRGR
ncbi:MAG: DUF922 domain-containing protein [Hoeflea sp.]|nr:DUF922 domain-containing protein [Hoeflea sp.]